MESNGNSLLPAFSLFIVGDIFSWIVSQAEKVFNQDLYFKRTMKYVGEPMTHLESIASSAVRILFLSFSNLLLVFTGEQFLSSIDWISVCDTWVYKSEIVHYLFARCGLLLKLRLRSSFASPHLDGLQGGKRKKKSISSYRRFTSSCSLMEIDSYIMPYRVSAC